MSGIDLDDRRRSSYGTKMVLQGILTFPFGMFFLMAELFLFLEKLDTD